MADQQSNSELVGAVWVKTKERDGEKMKFLSMAIDASKLPSKDGVNLLAFRNKKKNSSKDPDFRIVYFKDDIDKYSSKPQSPQNDEEDFL